MVLVAHGTRDPVGLATIEAIARRVRGHGIDVRVAYADVVRPSVADVLTPEAVVVPAFLAAGYHVRVDLPSQVDSAVPAPHLGVAVVEAAHDRLLEAGLRTGDAVVLAAAGSSDDRATAEVRQAADELAERLGVPVTVGYVAGSAPKLAEVVAELAAQGRRVAVASWLLAPGLFHTRALACGADVVAAPIGDHPVVAKELVRNYRRRGANPGQAKRPSSQ